MNDKQWYKKGYDKGYKEGQKMMINLNNGEAIIRCDNLAYIAGRMSKEKEIRNAIDEIKQWYHLVDKQALAKDPCVVDAMIDSFIRTIRKHTEVQE